MNIEPRGKQVEILDLPLEGHNAVLGVAGSGKSVCAALRAAFLSNVKNEPVLLLSFNNSLVNFLRNISSELLSNVTVCTYHYFLTNYLRKKSLLRSNSILNTDYKKSMLIKQAIKNIKNICGENNTLNRESFILEEIRWMQRIGALERNVYEEIKRVGRGDGRLMKENRRYIFDVYEEYIRLREKNGYEYDWDDIAYYFEKIVSKSQEDVMYKHIIIDEGQDFSPMMIKSIASYVKNSGSILFLGDTAQQIYGNKVSWKSSGLNVKKVYRLNENYRNTKQIEKMGNEIRSMMNLSEEEIHYSINSTTEGEKPEIVGFENKKDENNFIIKETEILSQNGNVAILLRKNEDVEKVHTMLNNNGIYSIVIDRYTKEFKENNVFIGTYHSTKGLEFDSVIIPYCDNEKLIDEERIAALESTYEIMNEILKLLYVAITRARTNLKITYSKELISILKELQSADYVL